MLFRAGFYNKKNRVSIQLRLEPICSPSPTRPANAQARKPQSEVRTVYQISSADLHRRSPLPKQHHHPASRRQLLKVISTSHPFFVVGTASRELPPQRVFVINCSVPASETPGCPPPSLLIHRQRSTSSYGVWMDKKS